MIVVICNAAGAVAQECPGFVRFCFQSTSKPLPIPVLQTALMYVNDTPVVHRYMFLARHYPGGGGLCNPGIGETRRGQPRGKRAR